MRASIRIRLMILTIIPATVLMAYSGVQLHSALEVNRQVELFTTIAELSDVNYELVDALQLERTRTLEAFHLGSGGSMDMTGEQLTSARTASDEALRAVREHLSDAEAGLPAVLVAGYDEALASTEELMAQRPEVDAGTLTDASVQAAYQRNVDGLLALDGLAAPEVSDATIRSQLDIAASFARLKETALTRGDNLVLATTGSIDRNTATSRESALANQQALWLEVLDRLTTDGQQQAIVQAAGIDPQSELSALVGGLAAGNLGSAPDIAQDNQENATQLREVENQLATTGLSEVADVQEQARRHALIAGAVAVVVLLLTVLLIVSVTRGVVRPLRRLTALSRRVALSLPDTVEAVAEGREAPEVAHFEGADAALLRRRDELGELAIALGSATDQATAVALEQAKTRRGVQQTISDVARREQSLVERQLTLLEHLEDQEQDPEQLGQLFRLDHLATRMRRNAENLLLLSAGQLPGSDESDPLPLVDVIRTAAAETEQYSRVDVRVGLSTEVVGYAATPTSHLLAELIENATNFSPPQSRVTVATRRQSEGVTVTVTDRGLGMSEEDLADARHRLTAPPWLETAESRRLGLYVVGLMAQRLGIIVDLESAPEGGTEARVWIPDALLTARSASSGPDGLATEVAQGSVAALPAVPQPTRTPAGPVQAASTPPVPPPALQEPGSDALTAMQRLLDAQPSEPPPLPADVQPADTTPSLPSRQPALPQRRQPSTTGSGGGLSFAQASQGRTVELDATQVSRLMTRDEEESAADPTPPSPDPVGSDDGPVAMPPPPPTTPNVVNPIPQPPNPSTGGAASWSTPFPRREDQ